MSDLILSLSKIGCLIRAWIRFVLGWRGSKVAQ